MTFTDLTDNVAADHELPADTALAAAGFALGCQTIIDIIDEIDGPTRNERHEYAVTTTRQRRERQEDAE